MAVRPESHRGIQRGMGEEAVKILKGEYQTPVETGERNRKGEEKTNRLDFLHRGVTSDGFALWNPHHPHFGRRPNVTQRLNCGYQQAIC